jgi:EmrB/QacA subfamily drug resistance transporter
LKPAATQAHQVSQERPAPAHSARWALTALVLSMLMASLDTSITNISLPTMAHVFNASFQATQWIVLAYLLTLTSLIVSFGRLGDLVGRRRVLLIGIALFTLASMLCGAAPSLPLLIAARALQGIGAACMMALTNALVSETVPKEKTGSAMGLLGTMSAVGTALGPSLGGIILASLSWQAIFLVQVPIGMFTWFLARRHLPQQAKTTKNPSASFDHIGTVMLAATLAAYALAMTMGGGHFGPFNVLLLVLAGVGVTAFVFTESKVKSPLFRLSLFSDLRLTASLVMSVLITTVMMTTLVVAPFYLSRALALSPAIVGLSMSAGPIVAAFSGVPAGRVVDRFGAQKIVFLALIGMVIGLTWVANMPVSLGVLGYICPLVFVTASYATFQAANNTTVMSTVNAEQKGVVSGLLSLSRNLGLISGASAMGAVFDLTSGTADITLASADATATGMHWTFTVAAILVALALAAAAMRQRLSTISGHAQKTN